MRRVWLHALAAVCAPVVILQAAQSGPVPTDLQGLLARVGASVERYFARAQSLICTESVTLQSLGHDFLPDETPRRRLTYELRIGWEPSADNVPEATMQRQLLFVGGRAPRPKDKPGCMDPKEVSPEPLSILLPSQQGGYSFALAGSQRINGRDAIRLDYTSLETGPITSRMTGEDCWSMELPGRVRGRFWIDVQTTDVLRLDQRLTGMFDVTLPPTRNRRDRVIMTIERLDSSTIYRPVTFTAPDETVMLPKSVDTLTVVRNSGAPRVRKTQAFSNYRRFMTEGRIVED